MSLNDVLS